MISNARTAVPTEVIVSQQVLKPNSHVKASAVNAVPVREKDDLAALQAFDPVIGIFLLNWRKGILPSKGEVAQGPEGLRELVRQWPRIREEKGVLYRKVQLPPIGESVLQLVLPIALQAEVLNNVHNNNGHQGVERTMTLLRERCYWPGMWKDVKQWCSKCERCVLAKATHPKFRTYMGSLTASRPLEIIAIDFTLMERASNGQENVLVVTDVLSKLLKHLPPQITELRLWLIYLWKSGFVCMVFLSVYILTKAVALRVSCSNISVIFMEFKRVVPPHTIPRGIGSANVLIERCTIC